MANSLLSDNTSLISYSILIAGQEISQILDIMSIQISNELNRIPYAKIKITDGGSAEDDKFLGGNSSNYEPGKEIEIKLGYETSEKTVFKGIITKHAMKISNGKAYLLVECRHKAVKMTIGRKNKIYTNKKDSEIISEIIQAHGLTKEVEATTFKHEQLVQHYASDWDFVLMRADLNGMLICADVDKLKIKEPDFGATAKYEVEYGITLYDLDVEVDARNQYKAATAISWDADKQEIVEASGATNSGKLAGNFTSSKLADVIGLEEYLIQTPTSIPSAMLKTWATAKLTKSKLAMIQGSVTFRGVDNVIPGDILELKGLSERFNGNVFIEGVFHTIENGEWKTKAKIGMSDEWYAETQAQINAPQSSGYTPGIQGLTLGVVKQIHEDPNGAYRIKVTLPILKNDNTQIWARMSSLYATTSAGFFFYPEIGDEVLVGFVNNDPQNPIILGSMFNKVNKTPLEPNDKNNEKAIVTKNQLKIHFEDEKKIITIETPGGNIVVLDDDASTITITDINKNNIEMAESGITLNSPKDINIKADGAINLEAVKSITLKSSGDDVAAEGLNVKLKGSVGFAAEGSATAEVKASGQTTIKGGVVMIN